MKTLTELIQNYQNGIPDSDSEILKRMEPLVKGYASRIHCMEREDSTQELYLTLLKTLPYLSSSSSEGECIRYMQTSVENRYRSLCRSCLSEPEKDDFDYEMAPLNFLDISSTNIRKDHNSNIEQVKDYIEKNDLYI